jgi:hypothetical protein
MAGVLVGSVVQVIVHEGHEEATKKSVGAGKSGVDSAECGGDQRDAFGIEWSAGFSSEETEFIVQEQSGRLTVIHGYPTDAIALACWG